MVFRGSYLGIYFRIRFWKVLIRVMNSILIVKS